MTIRGKQEFLETYDTEHARTMKVLNAYPTDKLDFRPHPKAKTARELAFVFVLERYLGTKGWEDYFAQKAPSGTARELGRPARHAGQSESRFPRPRQQRLGRGTPRERPLLQRTENDERDLPQGLDLVPPPRPDPPPRPVLRLSENGRREGAVDLRPERGRTVDLRPGNAGVTA